MSKLYEISKDLAATAEYLDGTEEDFFDENQAVVKRQLDSLQVEFEEKVYGLVKFIKNLESEYDSLKEEADHFAKRASSAKRKLDFLRNYLKWGLDASGQAKVKAGVFRVSLSDSKPSVVISCSINDIPMEFITVKIESMPDKDALRRAIESGRTIEGVSLVPNKSLRIT